MRRVHSTTFYKAKSIASAGLILAVILSISGCSGEPSKPSNTTPASQKSSPASTNTSAASSTPTPTNSAFTLKAESMDKSCEQVLSLQSLYDFDPNLALTPEVKASMGTIGTQQESLGAVSCLLTNLSSQENIQVVVSKLDAASTQHQSEVIATPTTGAQSYQVASGVPGLFIQTDGVGTAQFMSGNYWVSLTSKTFTSGVQASPLSYVIWSNLK